MEEEENGFEVPDWLHQLLDSALALVCGGAGVVGSMHALALVGADEALSWLLSIPVGIGLAAFTMRWALRRAEGRVRRDLEVMQEYFDSRLAEVEAAAKSAGAFTPGKETSFNRKLVRRVLSELNDRAAALDQPLPSGTKVDTWFEYAEMDWFITVKENLGNQQRLLLQGEVEDIILHAKPEGIAWVVVAIVTDEDVDLNTAGQLHRLRTYLERRERQLGELMTLDRAAEEKGDTAEPLVRGMFFLRCLVLPLRAASGTQPTV